jgi:hypothetical protein
LAGPTSVGVDAHQWIQDIIEPWQLAAAVFLVVVQSARQLLRVSRPEDLKAIVAASREAYELLRKMRPAVVNNTAKQTWPRRT